MQFRSHYHYVISFHIPQNPMNSVSSRLTHFHWEPVRGWDLLCETPLVRKTVGLKRGLDLSFSLSFFLFLISHPGLFQLCHIVIKKKKRCPLKDLHRGKKKNSWCAPKQTAVRRKLSTQRQWNFYWLEDAPARGERNEAAGCNHSPRIAPSSSQAEGSFEVKTQPSRQVKEVKLRWLSVLSGSDNELGTE